MVLLVPWEMRTTARNTVVASFACFELYLDLDALFENTMMKGRFLMMMVEGC
jgi:hypothetical protein